MADAACGVLPDILSPQPLQQELWPPPGSSLSLNCTFRLIDACNGNLTWLKDGTALEGLYSGQQSTCRKAKRVEDYLIEAVLLGFSALIPGLFKLKCLAISTILDGLNSSERFVSSILDVNITDEKDYGIFTCQMLNATASYILHRTDKAGHVAAVLFALSVLTALVAGSILYMKCKLNVLLWYRDKYGDPEINDGRLYDAYVSFCPSNVDTKFTNFILKPHLENKYGYKLHLDERSLLPNTEPSAELLMNVSRCRRLIVVLSLVYLQQDWCQTSFREGLVRLLELSRKPIFILFENQYKDLPAEVTQLLNSQKGSLKLLLWKSVSVSPSSDFWKEIRLALPRKVALPDGKGDPQTQFQEDKDPMLTLETDAADPDPDGDLGVRRTLYKAPPPRMAPDGSCMAERGPAGDVDISDLGSRNYSARNDYYCLVTEPDL